MVTEIVRYTLKPGVAQDYLKAFGAVEHHLKGAKGYIDHSLEQGIENPDQWVLMVHWATYEDHVNGFRGSPPWEQFRSAGTPFQAGQPEVAHFQSPR